MAQASRPPSPVPVHPALVILALSMGAFAIGTTEFAAMSLLPFFAGDLRISEPMAGHAISAYALGVVRSEEHTSELQSLMRISYAVFCLKKNKFNDQNLIRQSHTNNINDYVNNQ